MENKDNFVLVPREEYNILLMSQYTLDHIRVAASNDDNKYGYGTDTSRMIEFLLGIERKENAD